MSGAHEFISSLPNGYDTEVGENATKLSGGQRQRIDIARALLCDSSILILDEPTSSIDIESERWFLATIEKIRQSREIIIFIVTHNVQSIQNSDRILVLNNGKIESIGAHKELITGDSWYTKVQNSQN